MAHKAPITIELPSHVAFFRPLLLVFTDYLRRSGGVLNGFVARIKIFGRSRASGLQELARSWGWHAWELPLTCDAPQRLDSEAKETGHHCRQQGGQDQGTDSMLQMINAREANDVSFDRSFPAAQYQNVAPNVRR